MEEEEFVSKVSDLRKQVKVMKEIKERSVMQRRWKKKTVVASRYNLRGRRAAMSDRLLARQQLEKSLAGKTPSRRQ